jgi:hypothetical protein
MQSRLREYVALPPHTPLYTRPTDHPRFFHTSVVPHQGLNSGIIWCHPIRIPRSGTTADRDRDAEQRHERGIPYDFYVPEV